jgi:DNA-binding winged helix-turn-helix (wHTH) protein/tetratricopeptide (TPR) repeat protein
MRLSFANVVIDTEQYELLRNGQLQHVEPKVFSLLVYLAENPQRVIAVDELMKAIWNNRIVSDTTVSGCIKHARKAIGDDGSQQATIKTVRGRGFRFCADVAIDTGDASVATHGAAAETPALIHPHPDTVAFNPALAIQQFQAFSEAPGMLSFVRGLSMTLTTVLARIPLLRLTALSGNAAAATPREVHESIGADYVLSGSVQVVDDQVRVTVHLSDAKTGFNRWAHQFQIPGSVDQALDPAVLAVVAKLEPQLHRAMYDSVRARTSKPDALELYLQASGILALQGWHHDSFGTASGLLRESWKKAPEFAHAGSYLSLVLGLGYRLGLMPEQDKVRDEAFAAAERALQLETMDSSVLGLAGCALADLGHASRAMAILKQACELNPGNGQAWAALGSVNLSQRRVDEAISHLHRGIALSPLDSRLSVWGGVLSTALRASGDLPGAIKQAELACQRDDRTYMPRVVLAGALKAAGDKAGARAALKDAYRIKPDLTDMQIMYLVGKRQADELLAL